MSLDELREGAGRQFLFHYTDAVHADAIMEYRYFASGPSAVHGIGIYATDIAPAGPETLEDVIVRCFGGEATPAEVNHAIAVRLSSGDLRFEQTADPYQWVLPTGKLELVYVEGLYVATFAFDGAAWTIVDVEE